MIKRICRLILGCWLLWVSVPTFAMLPGIYLGGQGGVAQNSGTQDFTMGSSNTSKSFDNSNFGGRLYAGVQYNKYIGTEMGITYLGEDTINNLFGVSGATAEMDQFAVDALGKLSLPLPHHFEIYGKGGFAYVSSWANPSSTADNNGIKATPHIFGFQPVVGLGGQYDVSDTFSVDVSWLKYIQTGSDTSLDTNLFTVGIIIYAGSF